MEYRPGPMYTSFDIRMARVTLILTTTKGLLGIPKIGGNYSAYKTSVHSPNLDDLIGNLDDLRVS